MQKFSSDTQTVKLMKSFITGIDKLEKSVNDFAALFYDLKSKDFTKSAVDLITKIQKECDEVEKIISDRLINHVSENILSKTWIDSVSDELKTKLEPSKPLILELLEQKQKL
jgi:hypothetical protein